jgi:hypothetical protein
VLRRVFGPKREKLRGRLMHMRIFHSAPNIIGFIKSEDGHEVCIEDMK